MREPANLLEVASLDVDYLGFVFYPGSPRFVSAVADRIEAIRACPKQKVGVFVNETADSVLAGAETFRLDCLQLHGNESPALCRLLRKAGFSIIKAFSIASIGDMEQTESYAGDVCDYFLFDTKSYAYGGSGVRFDWSLVDAYQGTTPFLLSGGLSPACVREIKAMKHAQFAGIDLNSGFEKYPGMKDVGRLKRFIDEIRK